MHVITAEERAERIAHPRRDMGFLKINPHRRS
jgi:hypothetical protein